MTTANVQIRKILVGRGNTTISSNYAGVRGEITMNTTTKTLHVHDGVTTGGWPLATEFYVANLLAEYGGVPGPQGPQGNIGAQGPTGATGAQGPQGIQGNVGPQGIQGNAGATGPQGIQGNIGPAGATGPQGIQGNTGATGSQGIQGNVGATGATGPQGIQGNVGATGSQGPQGAAGAKGDQGIQGIQGNTGAQGVSVTLRGNVSSPAALPVPGTAGDGYIVDSTGNLWFWNSTITAWADIGKIVGPEGPQGPQGIQGNTGPQGIQGIQGNVGATGPQGIQGNTGATGPQGIQGIQGNTGATGPQGIQGNVGATGAQGPQGIQGNTGAQGPQGIQGNVGPAGAQGATGAQGIQGNIGPQGPTGPAGSAANTGDFTFTHSNLASSTNANIRITTNGNAFVLGSNGNLTLPNNMSFVSSPAMSTTGIVFGDGSYQNTAYTGAPVSQLINGVHTVNLDSTGNLTVPGSIFPTADNAYDLGSATNRFRHLYVAPGTIYLGNIKITDAGGKLSAVKVVNPGGADEELDPEDSDSFSNIRGGGGGAVEIRPVSFPYGEEGDTRGTMADSGEGGIYYCTVDWTGPNEGQGYGVDAAENYDKSQSINGTDMVLTVLKGQFSGLDSRMQSLSLPATQGWQLSQNNATDGYTRDCVAANASETEWTFTWQYVSGQDSTSFSQNDEFELTYTEPQTAIWERVHAGGMISFPNAGSIYQSPDPSPNRYNIAVNAEKDIVFTTDEGSQEFRFDSTGALVFPDNTVQTTAYTGGNGGGSGDRLTNGEYNLILDSAGKLSFPGNLAIDNGVISNLNSIDDGDLVVGSQIEVSIERTTITNQVTNSQGEGGPFLQTQSLIEVMAGNVTIGSQVINGAGDGPGSTLAVASLLQTNASNVIIGYATFNGLEESTLQTLNSVEVNSNNVLIGQRVTNLLNGNVTLDAFSGWEFSTDGNLTLPAGGDILNSNGQSVLTSVTVGNVTSGTEGALWYNTEDGRTYVYALDTWIDASPAVVPGNMVGYGQDGNITLNEDARINYANGVSIINSVYGDSQVASFMGAFTGNIAKIGATPLSIAAASVRLRSDNETWTFAPDGVVTLPNGMSIDSYGALGVNASIDIGGDDTRIRIDNNGAPPGFSITANATGGMASRTWHFGPDGDLSFPDGSTQTTAYTGGGGGTGNALVNGGYTVALQANGVVTIGANATISNDGEFKLWATDTDITVYRNGQDGYGVKAGNIKTYTDNVLRTVTNSNGFELKTGNLILSGDIGQPNRGFGNGPGTDLYITAGHTQGCSIPGGDTIISGGLGYGGVAHNGGNVTLRTGNYYSKQWNFDYDGTLTVPGGIEFTSSTAIIANVDVITVLDHVQSPAYQFTNGSEITGAGNNLNIQVPSGIPVGVANWAGGGGWNQAFYSNIATTGGTGTGLTVDVAAGGGGYIVIGTISINNPGSGYTDGDVITIDNENNIPGSFTVVVVPKDWTFDADGTLTFPTGGNLIFDSSATSVIDGVTSITANGNVTAAQYNFANGVNIFDTITGVTSINTSVSTLTVSDASGDYTYGALNYDYAVNGASNSFSIQYSAPLAFGNVDINVGNVTATGTANVANLIISGTAPGTLLGSTGDTAGMVRVDSNYIYYCTSTFVPASWTVGWGGATSNTLFLTQGDYPTPQVGWTVDQGGNGPWTIDTISDTGYGSWQITWVGIPYGSPTGGTATLTNPNPSTIWRTVPLNIVANAYVALGTGAGATSQGLGSVAVGLNAGNNTQGYYSVAVGIAAGRNSQADSTVAIGGEAGGDSQGVNSVAIGYRAGRSSQANSSIILNATGANLNATTANTLTVAPIRNTTGTDGLLQYNNTTKEVSYSSTLGGNLTVTGNITQQSAYYETFSNVTNSGGNLTCNFVNGTTFYATLTANVTVNFTNVVATAGRVTGATLIVDQGATPYGVANIQINSGGIQTVKWAGGVGTNPGTGSNTDIMSFSLISLDGTSWRILGQVSNYG